MASRTESFVSVAASNLNPPDNDPDIDRDAANSCSTEEVILDVGGTKFTTTLGTLVDRSDFFSALFSGRWNVPEQPDGSILVDADPDIFAHVLRYLRRGIFPLAYDSKAGGHDFWLYINLLPEARYFQIPMLEKWLEDELYLKCVEHTSVWKRLSDNGLGTETWSSSPGVQLVKRTTDVTHSWVCPNALKEDSHRLIYGHGLCGQPSEGVVNRQERTVWMEYGNRVVFHQGWCSDQGREFQDYWERASKSAKAGGFAGSMSSL